MDEYNDLNDYNEDILSTQILPKNDEGNQPNITNVDENTSLKEKEREKQISESDKKEKQRLIDIFANLREELEQDENKTIDQIYEDYANNDDTVKNNISKAFKSNWSKKGYKILLYFMFIIVLPFFTILNLIGTYQMLSFMNIFYDAIKNYVLCYFGWEDENEEYEFYNFYSYYFSESVNEGIDFDLMETMGFLGTILLNFSGFTVTSFFCLFINSVAAFFIFTFFNKYSGGKERYSAAQIIFLCFCYLLLFVGVGASALLSQQILIDNFYKFKLFLKENDAKKPSPNNIALEEEKEDKKEEEKEEEKEDEEDKKDISYFFLICTTSILGFFGKFILNYLILDAKYVFDKEYDANDAPNNISDLYDKMNDNETDNQINEIIFHHDRKLLSFTLIFIYGGSIVLSIIVYLLFGLIFDDTANDEEDEENENPRICKLCGYTIYSQNVKISFNKDKNREDKRTKVVKDNGLSHSLDINSVSRSETKKGKNLCQKIIGLIVYCSCYCFECTKLLCDTLRSCCNEIVCSFFCCSNDPKNYCCCCCIPNMTNDDYEQKEQFFCYCYQSKRKIKWFNKLMRDKTQRKLMPVLLEYFILQLTTIGLEKKYSEFSDEGYENFREKNYVGNIGGIFLLSLLLFIYLTYSFGTIFNVTTTQDVLFKGVVESLSNKILNGTYGIIIFNGFYSFVFSILHFTARLQNNNNFLLIPIYMNKFYFFTFAHYCTIYTDEAEGLDLISCSTLIAIYLWVWDLIFGYASDTFNINVLFGLQITVSCFIILAFLTLSSVFLFCLGTFWITFLYLLSFLFLPFGGCWFCKCYRKYNCENMSCCIDHKNTCNNHQCLYLIFGKRFLTEKLSKIYLKK